MARRRRGALATASRPRGWREGGALGAEALGSGAFGAVCRRRTAGGMHQVPGRTGLCRAGASAARSAPSNPSSSSPADSSSAPFTSALLHLLRLLLPLLLLLLLLPHLLLLPLLPLLLLLLLPLLLVLVLLLLRCQSEINSRSIQDRFKTRSRLIRDWIRINLRSAQNQLEIDSMSIRHRFETCQDRFKIN